MPKLDGTSYQDYGETKKKPSKKQKEALETYYKKSECVEFISSRQKNSKDYLRPFQEKWEEYYQLYRSVPDEGRQSYKGRANLFVPYVFSTIETVVPRLTANQPKPIVSPRNPEDMVSAKNMQKAVDYYLEQMRFKPKYKSWIRDMCMYGVGVVKLYWKKEGDEDRPEMEVMDISTGEIYFDPTTKDINDPHNWWIHEFKQDIEEIKENPNYKLDDADIMMNLENLSDGTDPSMDAYYESFRNYIVGNNTGKDSKAKKAILWEYWGEYPNEDGEMEPHIITILNKKWVIRKEKNPYPHERPPFIAVTDIVLPHEPIGIGEIEPLVSLQYELNDTRNQRMDNVTLAMNRMWIVGTAADVIDKELVSQPGGIIRAADPSQVVPVITPDMTKSAYNEESLIKGDIQLASGVSDMVPNVGSKQDTNAANSTVRGMAMIQEQSNARFQLKLDNIEDSMKVLGTMLVDMIQEFMPNDLVIRFQTEMGPVFKKLSKEELDGNFDFTVEMGSTQPMNRITRRAEARELISSVAPYLQLLPDGMQRLQRYFKFLEDTYDIPGSEESSIPPMPQMQNPMVTGSTPGQAGLNLAPNEAMYGQMGAIMGGGSGNQTPGEVRGLSPNLGMGQ